MGPGHWAGGELPTNFQLAFWRDAKSRYARLRGTARPDPAEFVMVIASLGFSVTFLFGANFHEQREKTPNLATMTRSWGLKASDRDLHRRFTTFESFFTDKVRHTDRQKMDSHLAILGLDEVRAFMRTVQDTWVWFQRAFYARAGIPVPEDQLVEFQEEF